MSKRGAGGGIKAAFARQARRAEAAMATASWPDLEVPDGATVQVPEDYLQQLASKFDAYLNKRDAIAKLASKSSRASAPPADDAAPADQQTEVAKWQANAEFCIQQLSMWPGSGVALQQQQQEVLLHIMVNADLHLDPLLSTKAYCLLLRNLAQHPPVLLSAPHQQQQQPPVLQCATSSGVCWQPFEHQSQVLLPDAPTPFPMLQQLLQNAVLLVTGKGVRASSGGGTSRSSKGAASQGQALLLLYVVQLLQADLLVRQVAFERYMLLSKTAEGAARKEEALIRAGTVLQHSLLHRIMQDDSIGGDAWRYIADSDKGKHQLVRDLLLLVCSTGDGLAQPAAKAAPDAAPAAAPSTPSSSAAAAAAAAGEDTEMVDADAEGTETEGGPQAAAAAAAAAGKPNVGVVPQPQQAPAAVSAQELIQSARVLLLLLLQLYSSCEEAGVYGKEGVGRHHMQRPGGGGQPNDRFELDDVMMTAIGYCGHSAASFTLPQLAQHTNLQRLLAALPPVHRVRLLSLMVASVIHNRVVDPESEGDLANKQYNLELQGLHDYLQAKGRARAGFRQPSPVYTTEAVDARLKWAAKEMFGGRAGLFPLLMATLVSAAAVTLRQAPGPDKQAFCLAGARVLDHVLLEGRDALRTAAAHGGRCAALSAMAAAKQQLAGLTC